MTVRLSATLFAAAGLLCAAAPAAAQETRHVAVRNLDARATDAAGVRIALARLSDAATRACGAGPDSLREYRVAVRRSACWHDAMTAALNQIGNPALTGAFRPRSN